MKTHMLDEFPEICMKNKEITRKLRARNFHAPMLLKTHVVKCSMFVRAMKLTGRPDLGPDRMGASRQEDSSSLHHHEKPRTLNCATRPFFACQRGRQFHLADIWPWTACSLGCCLGRSGRENHGQECRNSRVSHPKGRGGNYSHSSLIQVRSYGD